MAEEDDGVQAMRESLLSQVTRDERRLETHISDLKNEELAYNLLATSLRPHADSKLHDIAVTKAAAEAYSNKDATRATLRMAFNESVAARLKKAQDEKGGIFSSKPKVDQLALFRENVKEALDPTSRTSRALVMAMEIARHPYSATFRTNKDAADIFKKLQDHGVTDTAYVGDPALPTGPKAGTPQEERMRLYAYTPHAEFADTKEALRLSEHHERQIAEIRQRIDATIAKNPGEASRELAAAKQALESAAAGHRAGVSCLQRPREEQKATLQADRDQAGLDLKHVRDQALPALNTRVEALIHYVANQTAQGLDAGPGNAQLNDARDLRSRHESLATDLQAHLDGLNMDKPVWSDTPLRLRDRLVALSQEHNLSSGTPEVEKGMSLAKEQAKQGSATVDAAYWGTVKSNAPSPSTSQTSLASQENVASQSQPQQAPVVMRGPSLTR